MLRLPASCGSVDATGTVTDRAAASVSVLQSFAVTDCPAATKPTAKGTKPYTARFTTSATTPSDRTIAKYHWTFGDGKSRTTTSGITSHVFSNSAGRTVSVYVEDSAGAFSRTVSVRMNGTSLTVSATKPTVTYGGATTLRGRLTKAGTTTGLGARSLKIYRCTATGTSCRLLGTTTTSRAVSTLGRFSYRVTPKATSRYRVDYAGATGWLGTRRSTLVRVSH